MKTILLENLVVKPRSGWHGVPTRVVFGSVVNRSVVKCGDSIVKCGDGVKYDELRCFKVWLSTGKELVI